MKQKTIRKLNKKYGTNLKAEDIKVIAEGANKDKASIYKTAEKKLKLKAASN